MKLGDFDKLDLIMGALALVSFVGLIVLWVLK